MTIKISENLMQFYIFKYDFLFIFEMNTFSQNMK